MNEKSECDKYFALGVLLVLGIGFCVLSFFCGEEIMKKLWVHWGINLVLGIALIILVITFFVCCCVLSCSSIKSLENQYYVLTDENKNERETLLKQKNILVYSDVSFIYPRQFSGFYNLEKIEFFGEIKICDTAFFGCTNLKEIVFHNGVSGLGKYAFSGCKKLKQITYNNTMAEWRKIQQGENAFDGVKVSEVICTDGKIKISTKNKTTNDEKENTQKSGEEVKSDTEKQPVANTTPPTNTDQKNR